MTARPSTIGAEAQRFGRFVVAGPGLCDCALWIGAIADPHGGYGRFWLSAHPRRVVRAHRYALARALGGHLPFGTVAMHLCDNPICVRDRLRSPGSGNMVTAPWLGRTSWPAPNKRASR